MNENSPDTLFALLSEYNVEVPIIQRDYAQGRQDEHTRLVRRDLLADMKSSIQRNEKPMDLYFVYGKVEGDKFVPIDGQQRLTTLFLLHLYAFYDDESKSGLLRKFTYETRKSSREFLEKLTNNRSVVFGSKLKPSEEIEDSDWFLSGWKYDPTIQSTLTMLDDIKAVFDGVENLSLCLLDQEYKPIVFHFLEMKDLGMEDSLYIKLNARGKSLTAFENFKARLIGRLQQIHQVRKTFLEEFDQCLDRKWTDLFWREAKENFDRTYLTFFGGLFMNKGICQNDSNWSNILDYEKIETDLFETAYYTLQFLCNNPEYKQVHQLVFNALTGSRNYQDRVLFHAVTTYLYLAKGEDTGPFGQWIRIIKNMVFNSQIDDKDPYRRAINGINGFADNWNNLLMYFKEAGNIAGFSSEQIREEQIKAQIILQDDDFADELYKAEQHPYFSGQIRSALHYSRDNDGKYHKDVFVKYWEKISSLFDNTRPRHGHLLRQALLTFGDYTLRVGEYKTLCVDDPNEGSSTPSMKRLFSNHGSLAKNLLDNLILDDNIESQLQRIVKKSTVSKSDWRYCFIEFQNLFANMSISHLRLREANGELLMVPNKSSNGYNYGLFITALHESLKRHGIESYLEGDLGTWADRYLCVKGFTVQFEKGHFILKDANKTIVFETKTDSPIVEATEHLL